MADHLPGAQHPLLAAVRAVEDLLAGAVAAPAWSASAGEVEEALIGLARCRARLASVESVVVAAADRLEVGGASGVTSTGAWWAEVTRQTRGRSVAGVRHAAALQTRHLAVFEALAAGRVLPEQAEAVCRAVDALPADLPAGVVDAARTHLLEQAALFDARELAVLGRRVLEVVAPGVAEEVERERLEREETAAAAAASLTVARDGHGKVHGRFTIPEAEADVLLSALDALAAPRHHHAVHGAAPYASDSQGERLPRPARRGRAFCEYITSRRAGRTRVPHAGGVEATVTVAIDLAQLIVASQAPASLSTGTRLSAGKARLWACGAGIVPVVLGGASQPLDVGRTRRYFTKAQRLVLARVQGGCTAQGCDWPPAMCHAHHRTGWARGGRTDLDQGYLLCPRHHARAHDPAYETTYREHQVTFRRIPRHHRT